MTTPHLFDQPQRLTRMWLRFIEPDTVRTQEFVLRWSPDGGRTFRALQLVSDVPDWIGGGIGRRTRDRRLDCATIEGQYRAGGSPCRRPSVATVYRQGNLAQGGTQCCIACRSAS